MGRARRRGGAGRTAGLRAAIIAVATAIGLVLGPVPGAAADPPTAVTAVTFAPSSTSAGATQVTYAFAFTATSAMTADVSSITLTGPAGTVFPAAPNCGIYVITDTTTGDTNSCAAAVTGDGTNQVTVINRISAAAGDHLTFTANGVTNPTSAGNGSASIATSSDTVQVTKPFTVTAPTAVTAVTFAPTSTSAGATQVTFTYDFNATNALTGSFSTITLTGPAGTIFPAAPNCGIYVITDTTTGETNSCAAAVTGDGTNQVTVTNRISAAAGDHLTFTANGVTNPATAGNSTVTIATSSDPTPVPKPFNRTAPTAVTAVTFAPTSTSAGATQVTFTYDFNATNALTGSFSTITLTGPAGTIFPAAPNCGIYVITDTTTGDTNSCAAAVTGDGTNQVTVTNRVSAAAGDHLTFTANGVTNPTSAGNGSASIATSSDTVQVTKPFTVTAPTAVTAVTFAPTSTSAGATQVTFTYDFNATNALTGSFSTITLTGPAGTIFPAAPNCGIYVITDTTTGETNSCAAAVTGDGTNQVTVTNRISAAAGDHLTFTANGVTNPATAGNSTVTIATSSDPTPVPKPFNRTAPTAVTAVTFAPTSTSAGATQVTFTYDFNATNALTGSFSTITLTGPAGTIFPAAPNCGIYVITDTTTGDTNSCAAAVTGDGTNQVTVTNRVNAAAGDHLTFTANGVTNPATAGNSTVTIATSSDPTPVTKPFNRTAPTAVSNLTFSTNSTGAGVTGVRYTYGFTATSSLTAGFSTITLTGPAGTVFPAAPNCGVYVFTDTTTGIGDGCAGVTGAGTNQVTVTNRVNAAAGDTITFTANGVANTSAVGPATVTLATSSDPASASRPFNVQPALTIGGHVTFLDNGSPAPANGAPVQACTTDRSFCTSALFTTDASGSYSLRVTGDGSYVVTAFPPAGSNLTQASVGPLAAAAPGLSGVDLTLGAGPGLRSGVTITSPQFGTTTSASANPAVNWAQPFQIHLPASLFPAGQTTVVKTVEVRGTDTVTGQPFSRIVYVGGTATIPGPGAAGLTGAAGLVVGPGGIDVTVPALAPLHGPVNVSVNSFSYGSAQGDPTGVALAGPDPVLFTNDLLDQPAPLVATDFDVVHTLGSPTIVGPDAATFEVDQAVDDGLQGSIVTPNCFDALRILRSSGTGPGPTPSCDFSVDWSPPATPNASGLYRATMNVSITNTAGQPATLPVALLACDTRVLGAATCARLRVPGGGLEPVPGGGASAGAIYIDPSGTVQAMAADGSTAPVAGATVTLSRQDPADLTYAAVPQGSGIMSPANRTNPQTTDATGAFGWDTIAGTYKVAAQKAGCTPTPVSSGPLTVPPPALGVVLTLTCPGLTRTPTTTSLTPSSGTVTAGQVLTLATSVAGTAAPTGTVALTEGATALADLVVLPANGSSSFSTRTLTPGSHTVTASYGGDAANAPSQTQMTITVVAPPPAGATFVAVSPTRVWDSRTGPGPTGKLGPAGTRDITVTGIAGVPTTGVTAVVLNVTAVNPTASTFITAWPTGEARPLASNLNIGPGDIRPNLVIVKVGAGGVDTNGKVSFFNNGGTVDVIADIAGWYGPAAGQPYTGISPTRVWDSRTGPGPTGKLGPAGTRDITVTGIAGVPTTGVTAVVLNVTAVNPTASTFITAWPTGEARPLASNLNIGPGDIRPNLVIVKVGGGGVDTIGKVSFFNNGGTVDVIADIAGWYGPAAGQPYTGISPTRVWDSRTGPGPTGKLGPAGTRDITVTGIAGVPTTGVTAVVLNVTAVNPTASTFITAWPTGEARPLASNLNIGPGDIRPNLVIVKVGAGGVDTIGKVSFFNNGGTVDIVADIAGYYTGGG